MTKVALLIGVSEYEPGLNPLPGAVHDVEAMRRVLSHPEMGGFNPDDITVLKNPQKQEIEDAVYNLFDSRQKDDLLLLYFSGHGIKDESGKLYLSTCATRKKNGKLVKPSAVAASFLHESINDSRSQRQIVILDCCFSGAIAQGMTVKDDGMVNLKEALGGRGRAILTSSTSTQYSFEQQGGNLSVYTRYLVEGIENGAADQDGDGWISVDELHEYASSKAQQEAPAMTPKFYPVEEGHKIILAKAPLEDPKLKYRREFNAIARENNGDISYVNRLYLDELQNNLGLSTSDAQAVEMEVLEPLRKRQEKLHRYEQAVSAIAQRQYPISDSDRNGLKRLQAILNLRDRDIRDIEARVTSALVANTLSAVTNIPKDSPVSPQKTETLFEPQNTSNEDERRLEAAMPKKCKVGQATEIRVMVSLSTSEGLRAYLPDYTEAGDIIIKDDTIQNYFPFEFPIDPVTLKPQPVNITLVINAPLFNVTEAVKTLHLAPKHDSGIVTFFLTPNEHQKNARVIIELFKDAQRTILLSSLTLITEVRGQHDDITQAAWRIVSTTMKWAIVKVNSQREETIPQIPPTASGLPPLDPPIVNSQRKETIAQAPPTAPGLPPLARPIRTEDESIFRQVPEAPRQVRFNYYRFKLMVAGGIVLILTSIRFIYNTSKTMSPKVVEQPSSCIVNEVKAKQLYNSGKEKLDKRAYDDAIIDLQKAVCFGDDYIAAIAYKALGEIYFSKGEYQQAIENFSQAINKNGGGTTNEWNAQFYEARGDSYSQSGDRKNAFNDYTIAKKLYGLSKEESARGRIQALEQKINKANGV